MLLAAGEGNGGGMMMNMHIDIICICMGAYGRDYDVNVPCRSRLVVPYNIVRVEQAKQQFSFCLSTSSCLCISRYGTDRTEVSD